MKTVQHLSHGKYVEKSLVILRRYTSIAFLDKLKAYMLDGNDDDYPDIRVKGFEDLLKCRCEKAFRFNSDSVPRATLNRVWV